MKLLDNKKLNDNEQSFKQWFLNISEGIFKNSIESQYEAIKIPNEILCHSDIVYEIFRKDDFEINDESINNKIILTTNNLDVLELNTKISKKLKETPIYYFSVDTAADDNGMNLDIAMPTEFINSSTPNGLIPHKLTLKL